MIYEYFVFFFINIVLFIFSPTAAKKFTGIPMCALLANKRYELLYNCGIQLLHIGRPLAAFECLMEAVQVYHSNPRLWLRLAECCITANKGVQTLTHMWNYNLEWKTLGKTWVYSNRLNTYTAVQKFGFSKIFFLTKTINTLVSTWVRTY